MSNLKFGDLKPSLLSMGFGLYGDPTGTSADIEKTIIEVICLFTEDQKTFRMLLAWLEKCHDLVHVERLRSFSTDLSSFDLRILGAVSLKQVKNGDRRFSLIVEFIKKKLSKRKREQVPVHESSDEYLISKYGIDLEFQEFGLRSAKIDPSDSKKILSVNEILRRNVWLRLRALIGPNFRADLAFVMVHNLAQNPYQAAKILRCSQETAYRLWKGLSMYPSIEKLVG